MYSLLIFQLLNLFLVKINGSKQQVNIGLVYQNYARSKVYDKAFKETIRNINNGQSISWVPHNISF